MSMLKKTKKKNCQNLLAIMLTSGVIISGFNSESIMTVASASAQTFQVATNEEQSQNSQQFVAPQLINKASINSVVEAMTLQEKSYLVVGGNKGGLTDENGEIIGGQSTKVPGAAGQTQAIPRLGIPAIVMADGR